MGEQSRSTGLLALGVCLTLSFASTCWGAIIPIHGASGSSTPYEYLAALPWGQGLGVKGPVDGQIYPQGPSLYSVFIVR